MYFFEKEHHEINTRNKKRSSGFLVGLLKELPEVFTQGKDIVELRENIKDALELYLED